LAPLLYQLKETALPLSDHIPYCRQGLPLPSQDAFVFLGDVLRIDKQKKEIHLNNKTVVAYNYLIIATGTKPSVYGGTHEAEFSAGLQALIDAVRVKKKISSLIPKTIPHLKRPRFTCRETPHSSEIEKILLPYEALVSQATIDLSSFNKRLYQVQL
jgi:NADH dehydrogenase FAD-containing subunit